MMGYEVFKIVSKKHDGSLHRAWHENILLHDDGEVLIGGNSNTVVTEHDGKEWETKRPAIFYFDKNKWFNVVVLFSENDHFYYCNVSSPFTWENGELHYIDYDLDLIVSQDFSYVVKDEDEFEQNRKKYDYSNELQQDVINAKNELIDMIHLRQTPFNRTFIEDWKPKFFQLINRRS